MSDMSQSAVAQSDDEDEISLLDLLQVVADNLRLLVLGPLLVGLLALGATFFITPSFVASTRFMPPQQQQSSAASMLASLGALGGLAGAASGLKNPADQYVAFMKSRTVSEALVERFDLLARYESKFKQDAVKELQTNVAISSGKDGLITVDVTDKAPQFAANLANAYVEELGKLLSRLAVTEAQQRRVFFEKQLNSAKDNLAKAEQALKASGVNGSALKASPAAAVEAVAKLKAGIAAQEVKLASMRGYLADSAPAFKQAQTELSAMRAQLGKAEQGEPVYASGESDYIAKFRDYKYFETLFELFAKQYEIARVDESREGAVIQVVDTAVPPERKSKPKKATIAVIAALAAGVVLLLFVFGRHALRSAGQSPEAAEKLARLRASFRAAFARK